MWADVFRTTGPFVQGLTTCTTGGGKKVRMKGGYSGREGSMEVQGAGKEEGNSQVQEGGEGEDQTP